MTGVYRSARRIVQNIAVRIYRFQHAVQILLIMQTYHIINKTADYAVIKF